MRKYAWRNTITATVSSPQSLYRGKLTFKTQNTCWLDTQDPVVVLVSIQSQFHSDIGGDLKMSALMTTIKSQVKGNITVLLAERAHIRAAALASCCDEQQAFTDALNAADALKERYESYFTGCNVVLWHSYICQDSTFLPSLASVHALYRDDPIFKEHLHSDALEHTEETIHDLLEQCACVLVLSNKGYRFQFYPGRACACTEYINSLLCIHKRIVWVDVFLAIEKKTVFTHVV